LFNENDSRVYSCDINEVKNFQTSYSINNRTRSFLKVQDGCDYKCTYCTIPRARGLSRSDTVENVIKQINEISKSDIKEIVLTGINLGDFGKSNPNNRFRQSSLLRLVKEIEKLQNNIRFRLSSIEPDLFDREIIDFISKSKKFVPHFHIPLQSGSNLILKKMKRKYDTKYYHDLIYYIKNKIPFSSIGCDVIVGFPNESDENFKETYSFLDKIDISYLHVFQFSKRNKTKASLMDNTIEKNIKINRSRILRDLSTKKRFTFYKKNIGQTRSVLFENDNKNGFLFGYTENYIRVKTKYDPGYRNQIINVKIDKLTGDGNILTKIN
jgi:threonylcarbamoyladenosine tRNA methylthiotransferase MtaB